MSDPQHTSAVENRLTTPWRDRWQTLARSWENRAADAGLSQVAAALRDAFRPLSPLIAQLLYVSQPTAALFGEADAVGALAELLETPPSLQPVEQHAGQDPSPPAPG